MIETLDVDDIIPPQDIEPGLWRAALPGAVESTALQGEIEKERMFDLGIKAPMGDRVAPNAYSETGIVTVIPGKFDSSYGGAVDLAKTQELAGDSLASMARGAPNFGVANEESACQINPVGAFGERIRRSAGQSSFQRVVRPDAQVSHRRKAIIWRLNPGDQEHLVAGNVGLSKLMIKMPPPATLTGLARPKIWLDPLNRALEAVGVEVGQ